MAGITGRFDADFQPFLKAVEQANTSLEKLEGHTKDVNTSMDALLGTAKEVAGAFGIAFSVGAVVNFGKELFADAQALDTLSKQTRTSIGDLQILTGATESYGISADEIGRALFNLRERIAGGDQSVTRAYARMGISMDEVRAKQNDAIGLLTLTQHGLADVSKETQDLSAKDLYGGKLASSMVGLTQGFDDVLAKSREANKGVEASTKVMAEYADAIDRAERSLKNVATIVVGAPLQGLDALRNALKEDVSWWKLAAAAIEDYRLHAGGAIFEGVANGLAAVNQGQKDIVLTAEKATDAQTKHANATAYMARIQAESAVPLLEYQAEYLDQLRQMGLLDAAHAKDIGVSGEQLQQYKADLEAVTKADQDRAKAQQEADKIALDSYKERIKSLETVTQATLKAYSFDGQISQLQALQAAEEDLARSVYAQIDSEKDRMKILEDLAAKRTVIAQQMNKLEQDHAKIVNDQVIDELDARTQLNAMYGQNADGSRKVADADRELQDALDELHAHKQEGIDQYYQEQMLREKFRGAITGETGALNENTDATNKNTDAKEKNDELTNQNTGKVDAFGNSIMKLTKITTELGTAIVPVNMHWDQLGKKLVENEGPFDKLNALMGIQKKATDDASASLDKYTGSIQLAAAASKSLADQMESYFPQGTNGAARLYMYGGDTAGEAAYKAAGGILNPGTGLNTVPQRAAGGPVTAGSAYLVGEQGPELFVPSQSGSISPNGAGVTVHNTFNIVDTESNIARRVADQITRSVMRSTRLS
jgi:hypothetical protein